MEEASRRGKDLSRPSGGRSPATSGFGLLTGVEEAYRGLGVEVVKAAVVDYAEGVGLRLKRRRIVESRSYGETMYRAASAESFFKSGRSRLFCDIDGEYLMRVTERMVRDELKSETRAVSCFGG